MKLEITKASEVQVKSVEWLWYPYIPYGKVTVLQGEAGDGKSTLILKFAAMLTRGEPMPFTDGEGAEPVNVIYQSTEDDADDTIVPRFIAAGGDTDRLLFINEKEQYLSFSDERLLEAIRQTKAKLIVLDPLSAYIGESTSINSANEVRRQFRPLIDIAKEQGCAIVIVHHMNKAIGQKALNRGVGSVDIVGAARSVLLVGRTDKERPDERILAQVKSNLAPTGNAILFSVDEGGIHWLEETARTADEVLGNVFAGVGRPDEQMQKAKEMLSALLADTQPKPQSEVMRHLKEAGVSESTAKKAKALLGIRSVKQGVQWFWLLPEGKDEQDFVTDKRRKDSVVMQDCFVGGTPDWLKGKSVEEQRKYFDYAYRFFENNFKKENIISAVVHLDEATPHMHLCFVPITDKGRLSSKDIIGGPKGLVGWQDKFYEYMHEKYTDITRGTPAKVSHRKHIPPFMFKVAGELYDHYGEICGAINDIGLVNNAKKKDAAISLLGRYAPEMAQLKVQLQSTDKHIAYLERELFSERDSNSNYRSINYEQELELKQANRKIYELNQKQKELEKVISKIPPEVLQQMAQQEKEARKRKSKGWER